MVNIKNVTINEPQFTIEKQCDRCLNTLYFSEAVVTDVETDPEGHVINASITCPICGNVIVLYSCPNELPIIVDDPAA
ncbi:MAG TPA: hypothetical protein VK436_15860 [Methanocella sp.]|nr:hypothetical protein [Methanocella sp.]